MWSTTTTSTSSQHHLFANTNSLPVFDNNIASFTANSPISGVFKNIELQPRRRQNSSCDQCRAGKRACDLRVNARGPATNRPCSNCKKWKKTCTSEWVRSSQRSQQNHQKQPERRRSFEESSVRPQPPVYLPHIGISPTTATTNTFDPELASAHSDSQESGSFPYPAFNESDHNSNSHGIVWPPPPLQTLEWSNIPTRLRSGEAINGDAGQQHTLESIWNGAYHAQPATSEWDASVSDPDSASSTQEHSSVVEVANKARRREDSGDPTYHVSPLITGLLGEDHSRLWIKQGLLKIYHDSMEGALSCWLVERNCPYSLSTVDSRDAWSSNWSNRIAKRVCALDEAYSKTGALSKADRTQASHVLNAVIMAFAAQWAQAGPRSDSRLPTQGEGVSHLPNNIFGREMQVSLWHKARNALAEASANPSFKVIFAGIVFALAQRPMTSTELDETKQTSDLTALDDLLEFDGPPIWLDIALRKLHDHQRKLFSGANGSRSTFSATNKQTFDLLYWLAVMFDTLSAAMNRRTFTVDDNESSRSSTVLEPEQNFNSWDAFWEGPPDPGGLESSIWGNYFLRKQSRAGDARKQATRWPCSYEDAACCLADAAPVKVLLFRRVGHLQDLIYQHAPSHLIDFAVAAVLEVYDHWAITYGLFIADCIANHETLPARIQSWYILLAGHWHLGVFIFADLLEKLDNDRIFIYNGCSMQAADLSATMRLSSVCVVSDLGRCSRYGSEELSFSQSPDFHHAVNKAALLTEPWTVVLVRVFGRAGHTLIRNMVMQRELELVMDVEDALKETGLRLQYCIDALWLLGKKSDMAMCAATVLQKAASNA